MVLGNYERQVRDEMLSRVQDSEASEEQDDLQEEMQKAAQDTEDDSQQVIFNDDE